MNMLLQKSLPSSCVTLLGEIEALRLEMKDKVNTATQTMTPIICELDKLVMMMVSMYVCCSGSSESEWLGKRSSVNVLKNFTEVL